MIPRESLVMPKPPPVQDGIQSWSRGSWHPAWPHHPALLRPAPLTQPPTHTLPRAPQYGGVKPAQQRVLVSCISSRFQAFPSRWLRVTGLQGRNLLQVLCKEAAEEQGEMSPSAHLLRKGIAACARPLLHAREATLGRGCSNCTKQESHGNLLPHLHLWDPPSSPLRLLLVSAAE